MLPHHRQRFVRSYVPELPNGVRLLAWSRAIYWVGWGLGEALLPIFILLFSKTFAEMGLMSSTVDITSLVSLPIIGFWADKVPAKRLVLIGLLLYPLVGLSYFFAGALGMAAFIVIARVVNGFNWELENIGIETYYRRTVEKGDIATAFGFIETWSHLAWIVAALIGMALILVMPIYWLLLGVAPFALIAYVVASRAPTDKPLQGGEAPLSVALSYATSMREWRSWDVRLWLLSALILFASIVSSLAYFFIPIDAYIAGANLPSVVLITVVGALPSLASYWLGRNADRGNPYSQITLGLTGVAVIALGLVLIPVYWFKLVAVLAVGLVLNLFYVVETRLVTTLGPAKTYGQRGSAFECVNVIGDMAAPVILGVAFDGIGYSATLVIILACAVVMIIELKRYAARRGFKILDVLA